MKFHYQSILTLRAALKASRQLTFAEQAQANEVLDTVRHAALMHYGTGAPCKLPDEGDSRVERLLKHHGLYEVCTYAADNFPDGGEIPEGLQDLVMGLAREASNSYAVSTHHDSHRLTAPATMQAAALQPPKRLSLGDGARLSEAEDTARDAVAMAENANRRCEALETRIAALESALSSENQAGPNAGAEKEGAT